MKSLPFIVYMFTKNGEKKMRNTENSESLHCFARIASGVVNLFCCVIKWGFTVLSSKKEQTRYISPKGDKYFMS